MSYGMSKAMNGKNGDIELMKNIIPLNYFMAFFDAILVLVFVFAGVLLLLTVKKFSYQIYHNSKCKIILTLVMWSTGMALQVSSYFLQLWKG